jgi:hypothetical protein
MESYYEKAVEKWLRSHPGEFVTKSNVSELLGEAYGKAANMGNALAGLKETEFGQYIDVSPLTANFRQAKL